MKIKALLLGLCAMGLCATGWAGAAQAEEVGRLKIDLSRVFEGAQTAPADPIQSAVLPRTAMERRVGTDAVVGVGFLCGIQPGQSDKGSAGAFGYDPHGRFVGAKLSRAF